MKEILNDALAYWDDRLTEDVIVPTGSNGPWKQDMTEVRLLSHLVCLYVYQSKVFGGSTIKLNMLSEKLITSKWYKDCYYINRLNNKDDGNGLIGQAWVLEGLLAYAEISSDTRFLDRAIKIIKAHKFDYDKLGWVARGYGDKAHGAINQQIYFCAMILRASTLSKRPLLEREVSLFMDSLETKLANSIIGIPDHRSSNNIFSQYKLSNLKLSFGYYSFILLGLAILEKYSGGIEHRFYAHRNKIIRLFISISPYSETYNITDVELAVYESIVLLGDSKAYIERFKNKMHSNTSVNGVDLDTYWARLYEVTYVE